MALFFFCFCFFVDVYITVTKTTNVWLHDQLQKTILMSPAGIEPCSSQGLMRHRVYIWIQGEGESIYRNWCHCL